MGKMTRGLEKTRFEIRKEFSLLREKYGQLLIDFYKNKVSMEDWSRILLENFSGQELSFLFGIKIKDYIKRNYNLSLDNTRVDLGNHSEFVLEDNFSRLGVSPEKAAILTWICTDGYLEISKRGYYIRVRDEEQELLIYFTKLVNEVYGETKFWIYKLKNKNAYEVRICSKKILSDILTYIPLSSTLKWSFPLQHLDRNGIKSSLKILTQTEGCVFEQNRTRMIEITLANLEALTQAKFLFESLGIKVKDIRKDFSGGFKRYKLGISQRDNLEKYQSRIVFIPESKKDRKLRTILKDYKETHKMNSEDVIVSIIQERGLILTKEIVQLGKLDRSTASRTLRKLKALEKIDYKKGKGNERFWFINPILNNPIAQ